MINNIFYRIIWKFKDAFYEVKYFFQRMFRRYDDSQVIDLDYHLMKDALRRFKDYRKNNNHYLWKYHSFSKLSEEVRTNQDKLLYTKEESDAILAEMQWVLEELIKDEWWYEEYKDDWKYHRRIKRGKLLWIRYFHSLWL